MTCRDTLQCIHEPFGDAWYYGPERLCDRFENDEKARLESGFANATYRDIFENIEKENTQVCPHCSIVCFRAVSLLRHFPPILVLDIYRVCMVYGIASCIPLTNHYPCLL
jgi:hypothetical protein